MTHSTQCNLQMTKQKTWAKASQWVYDNKRLVRQIASPYFRFMAGDTEDLYQEATIVAYKTIVLTRKNGEPERFTPFFRVIFKTNCIKLASGVQTVHCLEDYALPSPEKPEEIREPKSGEINEALQAVSERQREVCLWLLQQTIPVSTPDIAKKFKVSRRHACRLVSNSIQRIAESVT